MSRESVPDATTLLRFRHLLEENTLTEKIFETVESQLREHGVLLSKGTLTDATILATPSSTKIQEKAPPRRYAAAKGREYAFRDLRRALAKDLGAKGFRIDCPGDNKVMRSPLVAAVMDLVA